MSTSEKTIGLGSVAPYAQQANNGYDFQWIDGKLVNRQNAVSNGSGIVIDDYVSAPKGLGLNTSKFSFDKDLSDYDKFMSFTPEHQAKLKEVGLKFDKNNNFDFSEVKNTGDKRGWFDLDSKGQSKAGGVLDSIGTGVKALTGLGSIYFAKKNYDLQKDHQNYLKGRDAIADSKIAKIQDNYEKAATLNG